MKKYFLILTILLLSACTQEETEEPINDSTTDIIEKVARDPQKYAQETNGLEEEEKQAVIGVLDFYSLLATQEFDKLPSTLSKDIPQDPSVIVQYYKDKYEENNLNLLDYKVKTIELDDTSETSMVLHMELVINIAGEKYSQTDEVVMHKDSDNNWKVYSVQLLKSSS